MIADTQFQFWCGSRRELCWDVRYLGGGLAVCAQPLQLWQPITMAPNKMLAHDCMHCLLGPSAHL